MFTAPLFISQKEETTLVFNKDFKFISEQLFTYWYSLNVKKEKVY